MVMDKLKAGVRTRDPISGLSSHLFITVEVNTLVLLSHKDMGLYILSSVPRLELASN